MVPEALRAWHAGASHWAGESDINSASIGIEIQNPGHDRGYPDFPPAQMQAIAALCRDIAQRRAHRAGGHPRPFGRVAGAQDRSGREVRLGVAGELRASATGWSRRRSTRLCADLIPAEQTAAIVEAQTLLRRYGYDVEAHGELDERTRIVVRAFQLHFRPGSRRRQSRSPDLRHAHPPRCRAAGAGHQLTSLMLSYGDYLSRGATKSSRLKR